MTPSQSQQPAPSGVPAELRSRLKQSITGFVAQTIRPIVETDKVIWNARIRRNELYYRGQQYLSYLATGSGLADYQNIGQNQPLTLSTNGASNQSTLYDYVLNFFQGDVDTFIAVLGGRSPNVQAQARDLSNEQQIQMKMKADRTAAWLYSHWNVETLHEKLIRGLALYGTMFSHVRYTVNPRKLGHSQRTQYTVQNVPMGNAYYQCPYCGTETPSDHAQMLAAQTPGLPPNAVPCSRCGQLLGMESLVQPQSMPSLVPSGTIKYPNGAVEISILNPATVTAPIWLPDLTDAPWIIKETEEDKGALAQAYPELRPKIYSSDYSVNGDAARAMGSYTRDLLTSSTGFVVDRSRGRWLHTMLWYSPAAFEYLPNDSDGSLRDALLEQYPDGFRVPMVNGELLPDRIIGERLTSTWAACKPKPSEMIYADPYFECMIQMQDCVNDSVSMVIEQAERSNPFVIADPEILNPDMLRQFNNVPGEFKFAKPGSVGSLDKGFFRVPAAELNPVLIQFIDKYVEWCRQITGITPAIFGGQASKQQTAHEAEINRNQALMKLNTPWTQVRMFWAQTYENGIYQAAKYSGGQLLSRGGRGVIEQTEIDGIAQLAQGGWYMRCEESMPETIGQRRDWIMTLMDKAPDVRNDMGWKDPSNIVKMQEAAGMSDWSTPNYDQVMRLYDVIGQLQNAAPQPGQPGPPGPMGQPAPPGPPQPSVPFNGFLFDPPLAYQVAREWLWSDKGNATSLDNPPGYANVMAYAMAAHAQIPPPGPPPKPPSLTTTVDFSELTPAGQAAFMREWNISPPPGAQGQPMALSKEQRDTQAQMQLAQQGIHPSNVEAAKLAVKLHEGLMQPPDGGLTPQRSPLAGAPQ